MRHRFLSFVLALVLGSSATAALAAGAVLAPTGDMSLGNPRAAVQVTEYASLSCSHCAAFNAEVFPAFKAKYIDTGKVHYTLKEFLTPPEQVAIAGFLIARCGGAAKYFPIVDGVLRSQPQWREGNIAPVLFGVAQANGVTEAEARACIADTAALDALTGRVQTAIDKDKVSSTPTFVVNGKRIAEGEIALADLDKAIAEARPLTPAQGAAHAAHHKGKGR